jgi:hypothetical protein
MDEYINTKHESIRILSNKMRRYIKYKASVMETETIKLNVRNYHKGTSERKRGRQLGSHFDERREWILACIFPY